MYSNFQRRKKAQHLRIPSTNASIYSCVCVN